MMTIPSRTARVALALLAVLSCTTWRVAAQSGAAAQEAPPGVSNYTRVDTMTACAGATGPEAMPKIKQLGFASVVNLRTASEPNANIPAEEAAAKQAGLKFIHLPFSGGAPDKTMVAKFLDAAKDKTNQPMYLHCASAQRAGAFWAIKRVMQDGWPTDKAMKEAETIGLTNAGLKQFALDYLKEQGK